MNATGQDHKDRWAPVLNGPFVRAIVLGEPLRVTPTNEDKLNLARVYCRNFGIDLPEQLQLGKQHILRRGNLQLTITVSSLDPLDFTAQRSADALKIRIKWPCELPDELEQAMCAAYWIGPIANIAITAEQILSANYPDDGLYDYQRPPAGCQISCINSDDLLRVTIETDGRIYRWPQLTIEPTPTPIGSAQPTPTVTSGQGTKSAPVEADGLVLIGADSIKPQPVNWVWKGRIPLGSVTVFAGLPGQGKSTTTLDLAANLSKGTLEGDLKGTPQRIVIASAEDSASRTMVPRLIAAGADLSMIKFVHINRDGVACGITLPEDIQTIREAMLTCGANILIIDPLMAHLSEKVDGYKDQHIRRALAPLARLADDLQAAVITIAHLNKSQTQELLDRVGGSRGITAAARAVFITACDPECPVNSNKFVLVHAKCNLSRPARTLCYEVVEQIITCDEESIPISKIVWGGECDLTTQDLAQHTPQPERHLRDEATDWLKEHLSDGRKAAVDTLKDGVRLGFSKSTLYRAKDKLGIVSEKMAFSEGGAWVWVLPPLPGEHSQTDSEDTHSSKADNLGESDTKKPTYVNRIAEDTQRHSIENLGDDGEHLQVAKETAVYPIGSVIRFNGGLGFEETGQIEAHTEWSQYPGQPCYLVKGRTIPHFRVLGVDDRHAGG